MADCFTPLLGAFGTYDKKKAEKAANVTVSKKYIFNG